MTTLPHSCAGCRKTWEPQPPGILKACPSLYSDCFTHTYIYTGCFTTCGHYCRRWFPRSLWSKKFT